MGHHKTFNDDTHIPQPVLKRAQLIAVVCAVLGLGSSFAGYMSSHDTHVVDKAHADTPAEAPKADTAKTEAAPAEASKAEAAPAESPKVNAAKAAAIEATPAQAAAVEAASHKAEAGHDASASAHEAGAGHGGGHAAPSIKKQFFFSWLTAFFFFTTLCLGGLFFTILHHLVRASWSTGLRRVAENMAMNIPIMAVCALVLTLGFGDLYHWSTTPLAEDPILEAKASYLNIGSFTTRSVIFFVIWILMALFFRGQSIKQDQSKTTEEAESYNFKMRKWAPLGMLTFALSLTFFAFDWLMSLDHHWFSTMFGVYIFAGTVVSLFATLIVVMLWFNANGILKKTITIGNFHDAGKLLFGFIVFWTYITFCQYYLIWYANIPEEIGWYMLRAQGGWENIGLLIAVGHFILPFWVIMSRHTKRNLTVLGTAAVWMLLMHFVDLYFVVMPTLHHHLHFHWMDVSAFVGIGGLFVLGFTYWSGKDAIIAHRDPQLVASMEYDNA